MKRLWFVTLVVLISSCKPCEKDSSETSEADSPPKPFLRSTPREAPPGWEKHGHCIGIAQNALDNFGMTTRPSVVIGDEAYRFEGKGAVPWFPQDVLGKKIRVTGDLAFSHLPMFIYDPEFHRKNPDIPVQQGIPMPPGTDIEKESRYYVIENAKWEVIDE